MKAKYFLVLPGYLIVSIAAMELSTAMKIVTILGVMTVDLTSYITAKMK